MTQQRAFNLNILVFVPEDDDCEIKSRIKLWIKIRREQGELDEMAAMEAFR